MREEASGAVVHPRFDSAIDACSSLNMANSGHLNFGCTTRFFFFQLFFVPLLLGFIFFKEFFCLPQLKNFASWPRRPHARGGPPAAI